MRKKYILLTIVLAFIVINVHAQDNKNINPFIYGKNVATIENNFENLFRNVKQIVDNPDSIQFLGYDYIGTVQNVEDAKKYLSEDIHAGASTVAFRITGTRVIEPDENGNSVTKPVRYINIVPSSTPDVKNNQQIMKNLVSKIAAGIHKGDKVYQIHFVLNHKKMDYNVFVNPRTKQVRSKYNAFLLPALKPESIN